MNDQLQRAVWTVLLRRKGILFPAGDWDEGVWVPYISEHAACCDAIAPPNRRNPTTLLRHCVTIRHIAAIHGVEERELRRTMRTFYRSLTRIRKLFEIVQEFMDSIKENGDAPRIQTVATDTTNADQ